MEPMIEIVKIGDPVLSEIAKPHKGFDSSFRMLTELMLDSLEEAGGVGLAAPQIGVSERFFVVDIRDGRRFVFVNPEILSTSVETAVMEEGCLSVPGVYHDVERPRRISIQAQDASGRSFTLDAEGYLARVIQHEYDHLDGKLFIDRIGEKEREKMLKAYEKKNRRNGKRGK